MGYVPDAHRGAGAQTLSDMREHCREMGLSELGSDVGRAAVLLLRLVLAVSLSAETVASQVELTKKLLSVVVATKLGAWTRLSKVSAALSDYNSDELQL
jgi:hypothetical protein